MMPPPLQQKQGGHKQPEVDLAVAAFANPRNASLKDQARACQALDKLLGKPQHALLARAGVQRILNHDEEHWVAAVFANDDLCANCLACTFDLSSASAHRSRSESIVSALAARVLGAPLPLCVQLMSALIAALARGDLLPLDARPSLPSLVQNLFARLQTLPLVPRGPGKAAADWAAYGKLAQLSCDVLTRTPDGLGVLVAATSNVLAPLILAAAAGGERGALPGSEALRVTLLVVAGGSSSSSPVPRASRLAPPCSLAEADVWGALAGTCAAFVSSRARAPAQAWDAALDLARWALEWAARLRSAAPPWRRRNSDQRGIAAAYHALDLCSGARPHAVEAALLPAHREFLLEFPEAREAAAPAHARLGPAHLLGLLRGVVAAASRGAAAESLDCGDLLERAALFDLALVLQLHPQQPDAHALAAQLLDACGDADAAPELAAAAVRAARHLWPGLALPSAAAASSKPASLSASELDGVVPTFASGAADFARALAFADASLTPDPARVLYEACVEAETCTSPPGPGAPQELEWAARWGAHALAHTTLRCSKGFASDTFAQLEELLRHKHVAGLRLVWQLEREMLLLAPAARDSKVAAFFAKNRASCASWARRLALAAARNEFESSAGTGAGVLWHVARTLPHLAAPRPDLCVLAMDVLVARRERDCVEALGEWMLGAAAAGGASRPYVAGCALAADGAFLAAAGSFRRAVREAAGDGAGASAAVSPEVVTASVQGALEALVKVGDWGAATDFISELAQLQQRVWSTFDPPLADALADALVPQVFTRDVVLALALDPSCQLSPIATAAAAAGTAPAAATHQTAVRHVAALLRGPSPSDLEALSGLPAGLRQAGLASSRALASAEALRAAGEALSRPGRFLASAGEDADDVWAVLGQVRDKCGFAPDVAAAARVASRAAAAGDLAAAEWVVSRVSAAGVAGGRSGRGGAGRAGLELARALRRAGRPVAAWLVSGAELERLMAAPGKPEGVAALTDADAWMDWAAECRRAGARAEAVAAWAEAMHLGGGAAAAGVLYLQALDEAPEQGFSDLIPLQCLQQMLPHLSCRSRDARMVGPLVRAVLAAPRSVLWTLVAEPDSLACARALEAARRACGPEVEATLALHRRLVSAARTWDEDWDALLGDLAADKARLRLALASPDFLLKPVADLFQRTLASPAPCSTYNAQFRASAAGEAVAALHSGLAFAAAPRDLSADVDAALRAVREHMHVQGARRSLQDLDEERQAGVARQPPGGRAGMPGLEGAAVAGVEDAVEVLATKTRPRRVGLVDEAGRRQDYLLKSAEDLHLDQRVVGVWGFINARLGRGRLWTYAVVPLGRRVGLVQWVDRALPLFHWYRSWREEQQLPGSGTDEPEQFRRLAQGERGGQEDRRHALAAMREPVDGELLARALWASAASVESWWGKSVAFGESCGVASAAGWALGLGDRHLDNILLEPESGHVVHVDLNVCFDKGQALRVPETVPFRLTPLLARAFPLHELAATHGPPKGVFAGSCARGVRAVRQAKAEVLAALDAFVHDPVVGRSDAAKRQRLKWDLDCALALFRRDAADWLEVRGPSSNISSSERAHPSAAAAANVQDPQVKALLELRPSAAAALAGASPTETEMDVRTAVERARVAGLRALAECARQRDLVAQSLSLVLGGRLQALASADPTPPADLFAAALPPPPPYQKQQQQQAKYRETEAEIFAMERRCVSECQGALGTLCSRLAACHPTMASLGLDWGATLDQALKTSAAAAYASAASAALAAAAKPPSSRLGDVSAVVQAVGAFRSQAADALERAKAVEAAWKRLASPQTPAQLAAVSRQERALRRVRDALALADAALLVTHMASARPGLPAEHEALAAMRDAQQRAEAFARGPVWARACARAPQPPADLLQGLGSGALHEYSALRASELRPEQAAQAAQLLRRAVGELEELLLLARQDEDQGEAAHAAVQAKERVRARLEDAEQDAAALVAELIREATDEGNLADMYEGWMAWI